MTSELVLGCGQLFTPILTLDGRDHYHEPVFLDINRDHKPDVVHDLNVMPWPFSDNTFDEVHAYEVLEHLGWQGDAGSFFGTFTEIYRILKPGGHLFATVPDYRTEWAWGDPTHRRVITAGSLVFLSQAEYTAQVGKTAMSDYRGIYHDDFDIIDASYDRIPGRLCFALQAVKPSRYQP